MLRTFVIAALLSVLAVATTTILFTRTLHADEAAELSTAHGYAGTVSSGPEPAEGFKVFLQLIGTPSVGWPILLPQLGTYFVFLWAAAILGSWRLAREPVA